jgi:ABC-2 type transport system permease protein
MPPGNIDSGGFWGSFIGLLFLGAAFTSIGIFASSLTDNLVIAFIIAINISAYAYIGFELIYSMELFGNIDLFIRSLGISAHYSSISRGVVDTRDIIYFLSVILFFLFLTEFSLSKRKW